MDYAENMLQGCLNTALDEARAWNAGAGTESWLGGFLAAFVLAILLAPVVLYLYRRRIVALMHARSAAGPAVAPGATPTPQRPTSCAAPSDPESPAAAARERATALRAALAQGVGVFGLLVAIVFTISPDEPGLWPDNTVLEWLANAVLYPVFVLSLCLPIVLLGESSRRFTRLFWSRFAPLYAITVAIAVLSDDATSGPEKIEELLGGLGAILVLFAGIGGRRMRNVVPLLTLFLGFVVAALVLFAFGMDVVDRCMDEDSLAYVITGLALLIGGMWLLTRIAYAVLDRLSAAYRRKAFSGTQFQIGMWTLVVAILFGLGAGPETEGVNAWTLSIVPALAAGLAVYLWRLSVLTPYRPPVRLLFLRVFSTESRGQQLLDQIAFQWRFIGPIFLVGGPDLARANLEPHALLLFLRRRLREVFVRSREELAARLSGIDERTDPDGRYRVNEFLCFDDTWQHAVDALVGFCHVVVLDMRGFEATRRGAAFEATLLARHGALRRTVMLVDAHSDLLAIAGELSSVPGASLDQCVLMHTDQDKLGRDLFRTALTAACGAATRSDGSGSP